MHLPTPTTNLHLEVPAAAYDIVAIAMRNAACHAAPVLVQARSPGEPFHLAHSLPGEACTAAGA
jgi:hypothetical protein